MDTKDPDAVARSMAHSYMARHWRLRVAVPALTPSATAWRRLEAVATGCRIRVLLAPWFRREEGQRRRTPSAWRFTDGSHVLLITGPVYPPSIQVLDHRGASPELLRDSHDAVRWAISCFELPLMEPLVRQYLTLHGQIPQLPRELLMSLLTARSVDLRTYAIAHLRSHLT